VIKGEYIVLDNGIVTVYIMLPCIDIENKDIACIEMAIKMLNDELKER